MNRKEFIRTCSYSCLGLMGLSVLPAGCTPAKYIQASSVDNKIKIARTEFLNNNKIRRSVIVRAEGLDHPIVLYRFSENDFSAMLLVCTHQANELNVNGDLLTCPAHGSEFTNRGEVIRGPAEQNLKSYQITSDAENIYIHLS